MSAADTAPAKRGASTVLTGLNLLAFILGGTILPIPYAFKLSGIAVAIGLLLLVWMLNTYISQLVVESVALAGTRSLEDLVEVVLGKRIRRFLDWSMIILIFGTQAAAMVMVLDLGHRVLEFWGQDELFPSPAYPLFLASILIIWPLSSMRSLKSLAFTNSLGNGLLIALMVTVVILSLRSGLPTLTDHNVDIWLHFDSEMLLAFPMFSFSCYFMPVLVPSFLDMQDRAGFKKSVVLATSTAFVVYCLMGIFGFLQFGAHTDSDFLLNYPLDSPLTFIMTFCVYINTLVCCPITLYALRYGVFDLIWGHLPYSQWRHSLITLVTVLLAAIVAYLVPDLALIFSFTGATAVCLVCYVFPVWTYLTLYGPRFRDAEILLEYEDCHSDDSTIPHSKTPRATILSHSDRATLLDYGATDARELEADSSTDMEQEEPVPVSTRTTSRFIVPHLTLAQRSRALTAMSIGVLLSVLSIAALFKEAISGEGGDIPGPAGRIGRLAP